MKLVINFVSTLHDFGGVLGRPWTLPFGLSQFHGHGSWLVCEVAFRYFIKERAPKEHSLNKQHHGS